MNEDLYIEILPHMIEGPVKNPMRRVWSLIKDITPLKMGCICQQVHYDSIYEEAERLIKEWEDNENN